MELNQQPVIFVVEDNLIYQSLIAKELETLSENIHFYTTGGEILLWKTWTNALRSSSWITTWMAK